MPPPAPEAAPSLSQDVTPATQMPIDKTTQQTSEEVPSADDQSFADISVTIFEETVVEVPPAVDVAQPLTSDPTSAMPSQTESTCAEMNVENVEGDDTLAAVGGVASISQTSTSVTVAQTTESTVQVLTVESTSSDDPEIAVKCEYRTSQSHHR